MPGARLAQVVAHSPHTFLISFDGLKMSLRLLMSPSAVSARQQAGWRGDVQLPRPRPNR